MVAHQSDAAGWVKRLRLVAATIFVAAFVLNAEAHAQDCVASDAIEEPDIAANRAALEDVCVTIEGIEDGGRAWTLQVLTSARPGPLWVVLHDNEKGPFESGVHGLTRHGGAMIAVEAGEARDFEGQDPNGAFGEGPCEKLTSPAPLYTAAFARRARGRPIVALHSNRRGYAGPGGVSIAQPDEHETAFRARRAFPGAQSSDDTLVYIAGRMARPSNMARTWISRLNAKRIHVMYEHVTAASNDCSLSNYAALNGLGPYFNIEVVDEDASTQKRMIDLLMEMLRP